MLPMLHLAAAHLDRLDRHRRCAAVRHAHARQLVRQVGDRPVPGATGRPAVRAGRLAEGRLSGGACPAVAGDERAAVRDTGVRRTASVRAVRARSGAGRMGGGAARSGHRLRLLPPEGPGRRRLRKLFIDVLVVANTKIEIENPFVC